MISAGKHYSPRSRYHQVRVRVLSYRWGSCYPHSKTASRSTFRGCFLFQLPFLHRAGLPRKNRGAGLAHIRIWGGRQGRSYHKCDTRDIAGTINTGNKTAPVKLLPCNDSAAIKRSSLCSDDSMTADLIPRICCYSCH